MLIYLISPSYESSSVCAYLCIYFSFALPLMQLSYVNRKPLHTIKARFCQIRSKHCSNSIEKVFDCLLELKKTTTKGKIVQILFEKEWGRQ